MLLEPTGPVEVVAHRVMWSVLLCAVVLAVTRGWSGLRPARQPRVLAVLALAAVLIAVNWGVYVYGVTSGQTVQTALGYFTNPLVTVLLGVVVLRERLRWLQWVAVGIGTLAVGVLTVDYGGLPWIALVLACSFGVYGLLKNRVGQGVGALASMSVETAVLAPLAGAVLLWLAATGRGTFTAGGGSAGAVHAALVVMLGVVTVVPLVLFAGAARRVPLTTIGLLQYLAPTLQFLIGILVFRESMPASRWAGFALVWTALVMLSIDTWRHASATRRNRRTSAGVLVDV